MSRTFVPARAGCRYVVRMQSFQGGSTGEHPGVPGWFIDFMLALAVFVVACAVYVGSIEGEFVYDDQLQIVKNNLIQDPHQALRALVSDVWAFKGNVGRAWSNYWRPTFVAALIVQHRLFGLAHTEPWHAVNILLHALTCAVALGLARRLGLSRAVSFFGAVVFAVHPAHVESVAWISGLPDLLLAPALLGSLWLVRANADSPARWKMPAALGLYAIAQGAKEVAIFQCVLAALVVLSATDGGWRDAAARRRAFRAALPFAVLGAVYLGVRWWIVGSASLNVIGAPSKAQAVLSAPMVMAYYLRQTFWPAEIGPNYPLRALTIQTVTWLNTLVPLAAIATAALGAWWVSRRERAGPLLMAVYVLPLLPAMNISAFVPEQYVHDRYLYVSLLGAALLVGRAVELMATSAGKLAACVVPSIAGIAAAVPLTVVTLDYVPAWGSELALWTRAVQTDPKGGFVNAQLGLELSKAGKLDEALRAFDTALAAVPVPSGLLGRAEVNIKLGRHEEARRDLMEVYTIDNPQMRYLACERLVMCEVAMGRPDEAERLLRETREALPMYWCKTTEKLAVVLYQQGKKDEALAELEGARGRVASEFGGPAKLVLLRLANLYTELGRTGDARVAVAEYLEQTRTIADPDTQAQRRQATALAESLTR